MAVTLNDVALAAGVSASTVSLALSGSPKVNPKTQERIRRIAAQVHYVPNARARALAMGSTKLIAVVVPELNSFFYSELAQAIKDTVRASGYNVVLCSTDDRADEERAYIDMCRSGQVDGAIFTGIAECLKTNTEALSRLATECIPVVCIDRACDSDIIPVVLSDFESGAYTLTRYLIDLGHRDIGYVGMGPIAENPDVRLLGFRKAMAEAQLRVDEDFVHYGSDAFRQGFDVGSRLATEQRMPTAVVCMNDELAIGMIQSLTRAGIRVPDDVSVVGTDNISVSEFYTPPLTTVDVPKAELGRRAADLLMRLLKGESIPDEERKVVYQVEMRIRGSAAPRRAAGIGRQRTSQIHNRGEQNETHGHCRNICSARTL